MHMVCRPQEKSNRLHCSLHLEREDSSEVTKGTLGSQVVSMVGEKQKILEANSCQR